MCVVSKRERRKANVRRQRLINSNRETLIYVDESNNELHVPQIDSLTQNRTGCKGLSVLLKPIRSVVIDL